MYIDFMGTDAAIFRTLGKQTAMRTDQYNSRWLNGKCNQCPWQGPACVWGGIVGARKDGSGAGRWRWW